MNRQEFFTKLEYLLRGIPEYERMDALAYYNDYFDDAGVENEQQVICELGSPEVVAQMILDDYYRSQPENGSSSERQICPYEHKKTKSASFIDKIKNMDKTAKILLIILLVLTIPIWIGIVTGLFGALVGVLGALFSVVVAVGGSGISILIAGLACLVLGILRLIVSPIEGVVTIGVGALFAAIGMLLVLLFALLAFKWVPCFVRTIVKWLKGFGTDPEGGDEI